MGSADYLDLGNWNAVCSMCGRKRKASEMVKNWQGMYRCPNHNEPRQPQDFVRAVPDIQTPPWVQPPATQGNGTAFLEVSESATTLDLSSLADDTVDGADTVVITFTPGNSMAQVVITTLTTGTGWPASVTTLILNFGWGTVVLSYSDNSGLDVTVNDFGGRVVPLATHTLTAATLTVPGVETITGFDAGFPLGAITPSTFSGNTIAGLGAVTLLVAPFTVATILILDGTLAQGVVTSLTLNGNTYLGSAAIFQHISSQTYWSWVGAAISSAGTYPVAIL